MRILVGTCVLLSTSGTTYGRSRFGFKASRSAGLRIAVWVKGQATRWFHGGHVAHNIRYACRSRWLASRFESREAAGGTCAHQSCGHTS